MIEIIIYLGAGSLLGGLILYLCLRPRLHKVAKLNEDMQQKNLVILQENASLLNQKTQLADQCSDLKIELESLNTEKEKAHTAYLLLQVEKENTKQAIEDLKEQAQKSAKVFEEQAIEVANLNIEQAITTLGQKYQEYENAYKEEYEVMIGEAAAAYQLMSVENEEQINQLLHTLGELKAKTDSAVEAAKRAEEIRASADFYKLQLSDVDLKEIEMLRNVAPYLRDKEPLNKVIWKCYYENPTTDLIGRVVGSGVHTGIYKITNLTNGMCYVGQAANIADRWKQHIKRGVGADAPTRNKLYPAMIALGVENFSFEIVEECSRDLLNEREDYWQDYFKAKEFGYSIK